MDESPSALQDYFDMNVQALAQLTDLIRGKLDPVKRMIIVALITADVHGRDIVEQLAEEGVYSTDEFLWQ